MGRVAPPGVPPAEYAKVVKIREWEKLINLAKVGLNVKSMALLNQNKPTTIENQNKPKTIENPKKKKKENHLKRLKDSRKERIKSSPSNRLKTDLRNFYRRANHECKTKIENLEMMEDKDFLNYLEKNEIKFDKSLEEMKEISKTQGLSHYTTVFLENEKIIKINIGEVRIERSDLINLKESMLNDESSSIYSSRTLSSVNESEKDDSNIKRYEKERKKNVLIRCWKVYKKATGQKIERKAFAKHCSDTGIELPIGDYDKTIFGFMIKKYKVKGKYFLINRSKKKSEELRMLNPTFTESSNTTLPMYTNIEDIEWNIEGVIGYRRKNDNLQGLCAWSPVEGKKFKPTWELIEQIKPGNEQTWEQSNKEKETVHIEDMASIEEILENYF